MADRRPGRGALAQPLIREGDRPAARRWVTPTARTPADPQRYTRFVTIMKRALLLAAAALIVAVIAYSLQPREQNPVAMTFERMNNVANDLAMIKPRLRGTDASGNPFVVTADEAVQVGRSAHRARLKNVQADVTLKNDTWLTANAKSGLLDADARTLELTGAISVYSDSGYEIHTTRAHVDLAKGTMEGNDSVTGQGPLGTLRADRFSVDRNLQIVKLMGHVKMEFYAQHKAKKTP
jgi:lipopolysaccharide export system protein LptC